MKVRLRLPPAMWREVQAEARRVGMTPSRLLQWAWAQATLIDLRRSQEEPIADSATIRARLDAAEVRP